MGINAARRRPRPYAGRNGGRAQAPAALPPGTSQRDVSYQHFRQFHNFAKMKVNPNHS
jgi:hypothetical protein